MLIVKYFLYNILYLISLLFFLLALKTILGYFNKFIGVGQSNDLQWLVETETGNFVSVLRHPWKIWTTLETANIGALVLTRAAPIVYRKGFYWWAFRKTLEWWLGIFLQKKSDQEIRQIINRTMHPVSVPVHFCLSLLRASPRVCQILFGKSCDLPTPKDICQIKKQSFSNNFLF